MFLEVEIGDEELAYLRRMVPPYVHGMTGVDPSAIGEAMIVDDETLEATGIGSYQLRGLPEQV